MFKKISLLLLIVFVSACVEQKNATSQVPQNKIQIIQSNPLDLNKGANKNIYVYMANNLNMDVKALEQGLEAQGLSVINEPSKAGYIMYITPIFQGAMSEEVTRIQSAYGSPFENVQTMKDGSAIVVDVQIVSRKIPTSSRYNMVAITAATPSITSKQNLRMVAFVKGPKTEPKVYTALMQRLGTNIARSL